MTEPANSVTKRIGGLDGIRAVAAISVVFCHTVAGSTQIGGYAVNIFFVMSGFLILSILQKEREKIEAGTISFGSSLSRFWRRRILRICPVYYAVAVPVLLALIASTEIRPADALWFISYTQNYFIAATGNWTGFGYSWTLAIEQQFYVVFAVLMLVFPARLHRILLGSVALAIFTATAVVMLTRAIDLKILFRLPLVGFMLASAGGWAALAPPSNQKEKSRTLGLQVAGIALLAVIGSVLPADFVGGSPTASVLQMLFWLIGLTRIVTYVAENQDSLGTRILELPVLKFYGAISYSLYLVHGILVHWIKPIWFTAHGLPKIVAFAVERLSLFATILLLSTGIAYLTWRFIERAAMGKPANSTNAVPVVLSATRLRSGQ